VYLGQLGSPLGRSSGMGSRKWWCRPGLGDQGPAIGGYMTDSGDAGMAVATAVVIRSGLPRWLRYGWACLVTVASLGGWVVDYCSPPGPVGQVLRSLRSVRSDGGATGGERREADGGEEASSPAKLP